MSASIEKQLTTKKAKDFYKTLAKIKNDKEIARFLRDVFTLEELEEAIKRFETAQLLNKDYTYREIARKVGLSTATVTRVAYWLHHGTGGYRLALDKL